ncbi:MAG: GNAT family N-acetyltransferase [Pseudolysinimonas sp.]
MVKTFMRWTFTAHPAVAGSPPAGATILPIQDADLPEIAHIMVDGYRGTIDFEDETDDDALGELRGALTGSNGEPIREAWLLARTGAGEAAAAIATVRWRGMPFISYVFTADACKRNGYAGALIQHAAKALQAAGETELVLFVTVGNPARSLYERIGFVEAPDPAGLENPVV